MRTKRTAILSAITLVIFFSQFYLINQVPRWGLRSPFPFTVLRSIALPILTGTIGALGLSFTRERTRRRTLYLIIFASAAELIAIEAMVRRRSPRPEMLVLFLNAFIAAQFLGYGYDYLRGPTSSSRPRTNENGYLSTMAGFMSRILILFLGTLVGASFFVGRAIFTTPGVLICLAVVAPVILVAVISRLWTKGHDPA
jgi:hypothetical protein